MESNEVVPKELEVLRCLANGLVSKEIAVRIGRSKPTVELTVRLLCERFGARSRAHLVAIALTQGLLDPRLVERDDLGFQRAG